MGLHNPLSQGRTRGEEAAPSPVGQDRLRGVEEEEKEGEETGSGQQLGISPGPAMLPGQESSRCCPDSAQGGRARFQMSRMAAELLLCKAWRAAHRAEPPQERDSGCCQPRDRQGLDGASVEGLKNLGPWGRICHRTKLLCLAASPLQCWQT